MAQRTLPGLVGRHAGRPSLGRRWSTTPTLIRFAVVGATVQLIYLGSLIALLAMSIHYVPALLVAQVIAIAFAFPTYRVHVFEGTGPWRSQLVRFAGIWWSGAAASLVGVPLLVEFLRLPPVLAQVIVVVCVAALTFVAHQRLTFRRSRVATPPGAGHSSPLTCVGDQGTRP